MCTYRRRSRRTFWTCHILISICAPDSDLHDGDNDDGDGDGDADGDGDDDDDDDRGGDDVFYDNVGHLNQPCVVLRALPSLRTHSHAAFTRLRQNPITTSSIITSIILQYDQLPDHNYQKCSDHLADDNLIISADRTGGLFPKLGRVRTLGWHRAQSVVSLCNFDRDDDSLII